MLQLSLLTEDPASLPQPQASDEWYIPGQLIDSARKVLKEIDLDPASCEVAQQVVKAKRFYTFLDDGLSQPWFGRIWMNPPSSMPLVAQFTQRLVQEYQVGAVTAAIIVVNASTETVWFQALARACTRRLDWKGRLPFWNPNKLGASNRNKQAVFYFGHSPELFELSFADQGLIYGSPLIFKRG